MPLELQPPIEELVPTKHVTPLGLYTEESEHPEAAEWFAIPKFFSIEFDKQARDAATTKVQQGNKTVDEKFDPEQYRRVLISLNLRGWRLIVPPGMDFDKKVMTREAGNYFWKFLPENVARLTPDVVVWLADQIISCGGVIHTAGLLVETDSGQVLDFRRPPEGLRQGGALQVPDSLGDAVVSEAGGRHSAAGSRRKRAG